ncbi:hypothetical protein L596_004025 [Steinernema carpocapsae]|uniref:Uncharacterized protein n=1 Tax=Steinernema carpocapsae TaxID=34508 RepID=A0A4U8UUF9_STECR|nr:hypothetical protein L596_004025 [Steinernema carpocapsae]
MRRPIPPSPESFEEPSTTRRTVSKPKSALPVFDRLSPFDFGFSHDIRRAPQRFPTHKTTSHPLYDDEMIFPAFDDENSIDPNKEYVEVDLPRLLKDGTKSHLPADGKPMKMPELIVYDTLNPRNVPSFKKAKGTQPPGIPLRLLAAAPPAGPAPPGTQPRETLVPMNALKSASHINAPAPIKSTPASTSTKTSSMTMTTTRTTTTTPLPMTTEAQPEYENELGSKQQESNVEYEMSAESVPTYDPSKFYHTLPPKRYNQRENILTFCTKDVAIRDSNNLVIACGGEHDVWQPPRCPAGTDCFYASDSTYRICCAVSSG